MKDWWRVGLAGLVALAVSSCKQNRGPTERTRSPSRVSDQLPRPRDASQAERQAMVDEQLVARDITDPRVLEAMRRVPRHELVPPDVASLAYRDHPLPIGNGQTISQPYIVAAMTQLAEIEPSDKVLEVGTGSGYQAAVLAELAGEVFTIEIVEPLGERARQDLQRLGYEAIQTRIGDGYAGWPSEAPFDAIIVTAAPPAIPQPLKEQLAVGGKLVVPVGDDDQELRVITRTADGFRSQTVFPVRFVPMTGEAQQRQSNPQIEPSNAASPP